MLFIDVLIIDVSQNVVWKKLLSLVLIFLIIECCSFSSKRNLTNHILEANFGLGWPFTVFLYHHNIIPYLIPCFSFSDLLPMSRMLFLSPSHFFAFFLTEYFLQFPFYHYLYFSSDGSCQDGNFRRMAHAAIEQCFSATLLFWYSESAGLTIILKSNQLINGQTIVSFHTH